MKRTPRTPTERETLLRAVVNVSNAEARYLVASYYACQTMRKRLDGQLRHEVGEKVATEVGVQPVPIILNFTTERFGDLENTMAAGLSVYAKSSVVGQWCMSHVGVGPVITAGLLAHLDITRAPTAGHFWSFAGLNPEMVWNKGEKRPFNPDMKQLAYHLGECIKRTHNHDQSFYGRIYRERKALLIERDARGYNTERAKSYQTHSAEVRRTLKKGQLPAGNLDRQACNYTAKMFLSHLHAVMFWDHYRKLPPKPFVIEHRGHVHFIRPPHLDEFFPEMAAAYDRLEPLIAAE